MIKFCIMKNLIGDIKNAAFRRVYLLYGPETYLRHLWRDRLIRALIPDAGSMNLTSYSGGAVSEGAVIDEAETLPFLSDRRVIRLDDTGLFDRQTELLPDYMKQLPDYLTIVFCEEKVNKQGRLYKAVQKYGLCAEFAFQTEADLQKWILQKLGSRGLRIRKPDMDLLLSRTGTDMTRIGLEVDKLVHYCADSGEVTREAIELLTPDRIENRIFDMVSAVMERRRADALSLYGDLLALRERPTTILFRIVSQYRTLLVIRDLDSDGMSAKQIADAAGLHPYAVKKNLPLARKYSREALRRAMEFCADLEDDVKNGRLAEGMAAELALLGAEGAGG